MTSGEKRASDEWCMARTIGSLAPHLSEKARGDALTCVRAFQDPGARVRALNGIAPAFPEEKAAELRSEAFETAQGIAGPWQRCRALGEVAARSPGYREQAVAGVLAAVEELGSDSHRGKALARLGGLLPDHLIEPVLTLARALENDAARTSCLIYLAGYLPAEECEQVFAALPALGEGVMRWHLTLALSRFLPAHTLDQALAYARALSAVEGKALLLAGLAPHFPDQEEALKRQALAAAQQVTDPYTRVELLARLAGVLPEPERIELLQAELASVRASGDPLFCALAMEELAAGLPAGERSAALAEAWTMAGAVDDVCMRAEILASLLEHLPEAGRSEAAEDILRGFNLPEEPGTAD